MSYMTALKSGSTISLILSDHGTSGGATTGTLERLEPRWREYMSPAARTPTISYDGEEYPSIIHAVAATMLIYYCTPKVPRRVVERARTVLSDVRTPTAGAQTFINNVASGCDPGLVLNRSRWRRDLRGIVLHLYTRRLEGDRLLGELLKSTEGARLKYDDVSVLADTEETVGAVGSALETIRASMSIRQKGYHNGRSRIKRVERVKSAKRG